MVIWSKREVPRGFLRTRGPHTQALLAADPRRWVKEPVDPLGEVVLSAQEMSVGRGCMKLIEGFNLALHAGERVAVTGPSGIGKTTLLDTLAGRSHRLREA